MNNKRFEFIAIGIILIIISSCTNLMYTTIDVLRPAKVSFKADANNLLLVNNTVVQPTETGHTTQLVYQQTKNVLINTDSLGLFCISSLTEELQNKDFFSQVNSIVNSINSSGNFNTKQLLTSNQLQHLFAGHESNVVVSLDRLTVNDDLNEYYNEETGVYLASLEVKIGTDWSIYYKDTKKVMVEQFNDTIYWENESYNRSKAMGQLPVRHDALIDAAIVVGRNSSDRFVPYWEKQDRYFYSSRKKLMKQAMDSVFVKNWAGAIDVWKAAIEKSKSNSLKSKAANNIAIAYEILGDIDNALEYASKSYYFTEQLTLINYESYIRISDYLVKLTTRKKEIELLKSQLGK